MAVFLNFFLMDRYFLARFSSLSLSVSLSLCLSVSQLNLSQIFLVRSPFTPSPPAHTIFLYLPLSLSLLLSLSLSLSLSLEKGWASPKDVILKLAGMTTVNEENLT